MWSAQSSYGLRRLLLLTMCFSLIIFLIYRTPTWFDPLKGLPAGGVVSFPDETIPFLPPLGQGCRAASEDDAIGEVKLPCWTAAGPPTTLADVKIVMKTGIADLDKTEAFLDTFGSCVPDILIVSDASYEVGGHQVVDILAELPESYAYNNPDWAIYEEQHSIFNQGNIPTKSPQAWKLDRFKFLPMVESAYEAAPHAKWFVFIESDVYYFWDTLFRLLSTLDSGQTYYLGSPVPGSYGRWFAYGGGGIILSQKLVHDLLRGGQRKISALPQYVQMTIDDCCGDAILAYVIFEELGVRLDSLYPTFSGEEVKWMKINKEKWCTPLLGMHRVDSKLMRRLWRWERCRLPTDSPITYATLLDFLLRPPSSATGFQTNWDNGANEALPPEHEAHGSPGACYAACMNKQTCLQYAYSNSNSTCRLADFVMGGGPKEEMVSGCDLASLRTLGYDYTGNPGAFCREARWLLPHGPRSEGW